MLRTTYELADLEPGQIVELREARGAVRVRVHRSATLPEVIAALNPVAEEFLAGGQWFQLWDGEIVTMDSPEHPNQGGTVARLHRGPMVQEGTRGPVHGQADAG